jgi:hypothetical protein
MSDMELILQLARLEEQGENDQLGEDGIQSTSLQVDQKGSSSSSVGDGPSLGTALTTPPSAEEPYPSTSTQMTPIGPKTPTASGDEELQALADLEKELGLDDLQLYLDSTSSTTSRSDSSMTAEVGGPQSPFPTPASVMNTAQKVPDDDDNLDELERYLESLSAPPPK